MAYRHIKNGNQDSSPELAEGAAKVVVIGEPRCGKTRFIRTYYTRHEPSTIGSHNGVRFYPCEYELDGMHGRVSIYEIPGDPAYFAEQRRPHYEDAAAFVLVYAIDDPLSLEMLTDKWLPDIGDCIEGKPAVLVGTKKDLREDPQTIERLAQNNEIPVTYEEGAALLQMNAIKAFFECSADDLIRVDSAFKVILDFAVYGV